MSDRHRYERQLCLQCGQKLKPAPRATFKVQVSAEKLDYSGCVVPNHLRFRSEDDLQTWLTLTDHKITRRDTVWTSLNEGLVYHNVRAIEPALGWDGKGFFHSQHCATAWATRTCERFLNKEKLEGGEA